MTFENLEDVLTFAVGKEQKSVELYSMFREIVKNLAAKKLLESLANAEMGHKRMFENALASGRLPSIKGKKPLSSLGITDYMVVEPVGPESDPQQVMLYAIKREQESYDLYSTLLENYGATEIGGTFARLSEEERHHKETLEKEYEEHFMQWM